MTDFVSSSGDGLVYGYNTSENYSSARSTSYAYDITAQFHKLGQRNEDIGLFPALMYIWRMFLKFDTSSLGASSIITSVKLRLTAKSDNSSTDFDVQIVKQDWSSQDPIATGTREAAYDGCLAGTADNNIWRNTSGMSVDTPYESGELDTTWVNKTGNTYYSLRSSRDYAGTTPTKSIPPTEEIEIYTSESTTSSYRPYLVIEYTLNYMRLMMKIHTH